ncbi:hypothetical protein GCM10025792_15220 [Pseudonocardia tropica]
MPPGWDRVQSESASPGEPGGSPSSEPLAPAEGGGGAPPETGGPLSDEEAKYAPGLASPLESSDSGAFTGTGFTPVGPELGQPHTVGFELFIGIAAPGSTSRPVRLTVSGFPMHSIEITEIGFRAGDSEQFLLTNDRCSGRTLPPGGTCTIDVTFAPTRGGDASASLSMSLRHVCTATNYFPCAWSDELEGQGRDFERSAEYGHTVITWDSGFMGAAGALNVAGRATE